MPSINRKSVLSVLILPFLFNNLWSSRAAEGDTVLRVMPTQVSSINDKIPILLGSESALTPMRVAGIDDGSSVEADRNGHARPGAIGTIMIEGIGLNGASAVTFEGQGVTGEVVPIPSEDLNPGILVNVRIEPSAPLSPRHFTITTPNGDVSSGDVVLIVEAPRITAIGDQEGAPASDGLVSIAGVGLDGATDLAFSGGGVTGRIVVPRPNPLLNPPVFVDLRIDPSASLGERDFAVVTPRGTVMSGDVKFRVVSPRISGIIEGSGLGVEVKTNGEGAPGTGGRVFVTGIGLSDPTSIDFSGTGVTATVRAEGQMDGGFPTTASTAQASGLLNPAIQITMDIASNAPLGPRTFTMSVPRGSGKISSADFNIVFNVVPPHISSIRDSEGVPGACGRVTINGVGLKDASRISFDPPLQVTGSILAASGDLLNPPIQVQVRIGQRAQLGGYSFTVNSPSGTIRSGDTVFIVTTPRITKMNTAGGFFTILDVPDSIAPGTSGMAALQGVGLAGVTGVTFSGSGITATVLPLPPGLSGLNPGVLLRITASKTAVLGDRAITLAIGAAPAC